MSLYFIIGIVIGCLMMLALIGLGLAELGNLMFSFATDTRYKTYGIHHKITMKFPRVVREELGLYYVVAAITQIVLWPFYFIFIALIFSRRYFRRKRNE